MICVNQSYSGANSICIISDTGQSVASFVNDLCVNVWAHIKLNILLDASRSFLNNISPLSSFPLG